QFLIDNLKHKSRDNIKSLLRNKQVWVNGQFITRFNHQLNSGDNVVIKWSPSSYGSLSRSLRIVYQDDHLIVVDKFHGLLSIATEGEKQATAYSILSSFIKQQNRAAKIFVVHRLDRDTSGLMMFAKSEEVQTLLQSGWKESIVERTYMAVVEGQVEEPEGTIQSYIYESKALMMHTTKNPEKGDLAITHYRTIKSKPAYSLLEIKLETGRKNQIRLHLQEIGHSIAGDRKYGATGNPIARLALHASVLAFIHPVTREKMRFESPLPTKFRRLI
ncbi:MAG: RluA family pseudouridine synthase, partial [Bacteroidetes bacterium]|nr:RluA family pseudouridine synthase [Bacteroidota bacterium]